MIFTTQPSQVNWQLCYVPFMYFLFLAPSSAIISIPALLLIVVLPQMYFYFFVFSLVLELFLFLNLAFPSIRMLSKVWIFSAHLTPADLSFSAHLMLGEQEKRSYSGLFLYKFQLQTKLTGCKLTLLQLLSALSVSTQLRSCLIWKAEQKRGQTIAECENRLSMLHQIQTDETIIFLFTEDRAVNIT